MRSTVIRIEPGGQPPVPARPGGGRWRYFLAYSGQTKGVYADTYEELCEALIPGFDLTANTATENLDVLVEFADAQHVAAQAALVASHPGPVTASDRDVLLAPRHGPVPVERWANPVPLVVCDIHYQPDGPLPVAVGDGQVVVIRTGSPQEFIESFAHTGMVVLLTAT